MSILVTLVIIAAIAYSIYSGTKRGVILISLELASFIIAAALGLLAYQPVGVSIKALANVSQSLANIAAFVVLWAFTEVLCALFVRVNLLPLIIRRIKPTRTSRIGGGLLNALKVTAIMTLAISVFSGLPLSAATKQPVTGSLAARVLIAASGNLPQRLAGGLSQDIADSLNFFTVTADPESTEHIDLGYKTTDVKIDPSAEADMLVLLNNERTTRGLNALTLDITARSVARAYAADMFARGFFSHISPEGKTPFDRMSAAGIKYHNAGENLALAPTLQQAHDGLMKSPGHRANILSVNYKHVGIGVVDGGPYGLMVTQDFTD